jgi:hypothetical protein
MIGILVVGCGDSPRDEISSLETQGVVEERVRIDGHSENLVSIGAVAVRDDGAIAFAQAQDGQIRLYSASGELQGRFGRRGEGPGEFLALSQMGWHADTLWVYDGNQRRISKLSPQFELVSVGGISNAARPTPKEADRIPEFPFASLHRLGSDGTLYGTFGLAVNQVVPEPFPGRTTVGSMSLDGVIREVITSLPPSQYAEVTTASGGSAALPFGNSPRWRISAELGRVVVAMASVEGEHSGTYEVVALDLEGDTVFVRRFPFPVEPIPQSVGDSAIQERIAGVEQFLPDLADAVRRDGGYPPLYPPLVYLLLGSDGTVWIELRAQPEGVSYHVIDSDGNPTGTLALRPGSRISAASMNEVWVIESDEVGMPSLVKYSVTWQPLAKK